MGLLTVQGAGLLGYRILTAAADVVHPSVHFVTGLVGLGLYRHPGYLFGYGLAFGAGYFALGVFGALGAVDVPWFPLGPADHAFHVAFSTAVLLLSTAGLRSSIRVSPNGEVRP